jgi:hypothetical protein
MITCPRCGNNFRPMVSLAFFQLVLLILVILLLAGLAYFTGAGTWLGVAVIASLLLIFFYFPKIIDLEMVKPNLVVEGPAENKNLEWDDEETEEEGDNNFYKISCACTLLLLVIILGVLIAHLLK